MFQMYKRMAQNDLQEFAFLLQDFHFKKIKPH